MGLLIQDTALYGHAWSLSEWYGYITINSEHRLMHEPVERLYQWVWIVVYLFIYFAKIQGHHSLKVSVPDVFARLHGTVR